MQHSRAAWPAFALPGEEEEEEEGFAVFWGPGWLQGPAECGAPFGELCFPRGVPLPLPLPVLGWSRLFLQQG